MFPIIDLIASIGSLIVPPAFDFIKKKFIKSEDDTPERTLSALATTKPEVLPEYLASMTGWKDAEIRFFNRDVIGEASRWVVNLRASIRPIAVILSFLTLIGMAAASIAGYVSAEEVAQLEGVRLSCETIVGSWFGSRITLHN